MKDQLIKGFSKLSKQKKIEWLGKHYHDDPETLASVLKKFLLEDMQEQKIFDAFSENTVSNFLMPFSVAPNFIINDKAYCIPMVIEESSVVAAASSAAKFWSTRGGIRAEVIDTKKIGQIHFTCLQDGVILQQFFKETETEIRTELKELVRNMEARGGGVYDISFVSFPEEPEYYQLRITFATCDSMGANFINTYLEAFAKAFLQKHQLAFKEESRLQIIMCILSNYTPECIVRAEVSCPIEDLGKIAQLDALQFAYKFQKAIRIAEIDPYRATTHNKGIYNGIDAVVLATGNDFRAVEACGHTYASRHGSYASLSSCAIENDQIKFWLEVPMALGTVGGLTRLHPLAKLSLDILGNPNAAELMKIVCSVGLMQNFAAVKSLVSTGIQKGHMKMHLSNVLHQLKATEHEFKTAVEYFKDKIVSHRAVQEFLEKLRKLGSEGNNSSV